MDRCRPAALTAARRAGCLATPTGEQPPLPPNTGENTQCLSPRVRSCLSGSHSYLGRMLTFAIHSDSPGPSPGTNTNAQLEFVV